MWTAVKSNKCCATCANWCGSRSACGNAAKTDAPSSRGKCSAGVVGDATPGPTAMSGFSCGKYSPWSALR